MNMNDYPYCSLSEDGSLRSMGQHRLGFLRVNWDALIRLGYDEPILLYHCRRIQAHGLNMCEVRVEIPFNPTAPWMGVVVSSELDDAVKKMAHTALTSLCERKLATTTDMLIVPFPIHDQEDPVWQQCLESMSDHDGPHFSVGWAAMVKYMRYLFNL
jgi:hypothetical protein